jgi:hypothetical protein
MPDMDRGSSLAELEARRSGIASASDVNRKIPGPDLVAPPDLPLFGSPAAGGVASPRA